MQHPFDILKPEYAQLLSIMSVRPDRRAAVDHSARRLLGFKDRWAPISAENGVPIVFMATSFEREASSDFTRNPAQGWSWRQKSRDVPYNGPFASWHDAAIEAYRLNGLDKVGQGNWTWELICFYGEMFNGFGYRDYHHMHTPYLWAMTNVQQLGKYTADGHFDPGHFDEQIGIVPVAKRMVELDPSLALPDAPASAIPMPSPTGIAADRGVKWVQQSLNALGYPALVVDGNYGRKTMAAVTQFQRDHRLDADGIVGPKTTAAIEAALDKR